MDREDKAAPADTSRSREHERGGDGSAGTAREQTVNDTTTNQPPETAPDAAAEPTAARAADQTEPAEAAASAEAAEVVAGTSADATAETAPTAEAADQPEPAAQPDVAELQAELAALRAQVEERTEDLQRVTAEYANYRKRVERDRLAVAEQATAQVITALLPVLDDLDRAKEHGDLVGPFALVAEQLTSALAKFGLTGFGEVGDAFDPTRHEAVTHQTSADVTEPTCVTVMRRGYLLGERLLRPALVAVADPESQ
ncbi:MAG: nucleotide exchange factor GrpE [Micromonosporaceae bacterium]|nr:nucleotide exchange factor GrpE [Micromonosporaceae bacterium]